jgi:hypothetical protein
MIMPNAFTGSTESAHNSGGRRELARKGEFLSQFAEHFLDMEGVRGSIPLPPTIEIKMLPSRAFFLAHEMPVKQI